MTRTCVWCGNPFTTRSRTQRFCSKQHAGLWQYRNHVRRPHKWGERPDVDAAHRAIRKQLLPAAIGRPCPLCGQIMDATAQLDHILPRALGGKSTRTNCRMICRDCNQRLGSQLGAKIAHARRRRRTCWPL